MLYTDLIQSCQGFRQHERILPFCSKVLCQKRVVCHLRAHELLKAVRPVPCRAVSVYLRLAASLAHAGQDFHAFFVLARIP